MTEMNILAETDLRRVKQLKRVLQRAGIESHILRPTTGGGG